MQYQTLPMIMSCGLYYETDGLRELCHAVKQRNNDALTAAAECLSDIVSLYGLDGFHIIPIPNHSGRAEYTLEILKRLKTLRHDIEIDDILIGAEHQTMYDKKKSGGVLSSDELGFRLTGNLRSRNTILFDNVIGTGTTYFAAMDAVGIEMPLLVLGQSHETEHYEREWKRWLISKKEKEKSEHRF